MNDHVPVFREIDHPGGDLAIADDSADSVGGLMFGGKFGGGRGERGDAQKQCCAGECEEFHFHRSNHLSIRQIAAGPLSGASPQTGGRRIALAGFAEIC